MHTDLDLNLMTVFPNEVWTKISILNIPKTVVMFDFTSQICSFYKLSAPPAPHSFLTNTILKFDLILQIVLKLLKSEFSLKCTNLEAP